MAVDHGGAHLSRRDFGKLRRHRPCSDSLGLSLCGAALDEAMLYCNDNTAKRPAAARIASPVKAANPASRQDRSALGPKLRNTRIAVAQRHSSGRSIPTVLRLRPDGGAVTRRTTNHCTLVLFCSGPHTFLPRLS